MRNHTLRFSRDFQCPHCKDSGDLRLEKNKDKTTAFFCLRCAGNWTLRLRQDAPPDPSAIRAYDRKRP